MATEYSFHALRRGRLWKWVDVVSEQDTTKANSGVTLPKLSSFATSTATAYDPATDTAGNPYGSMANGISGITLDPTDEQQLAALEAAQYAQEISGQKYGFQFLWNPESLTINTDLNLNVTPNTSDMFSTTSQAYPSMETVSISIVLDRTNDFACFRGLRANGVVDYSINDLASKVSKFYPNRYGKSIEGSEGAELRQLLRLGTVYDIEYLYKTINSNSTTQNIVGRVTSDNGFLTPNAIGFQLGPTSNSIAYMGWISTVNVQHVAFTEDMIPIRSLVNLTFNVLTNGGAK